MAKNKLITFLNGISKIARKERWIKAYDKELDYFCWTNPKEAKGTRLVKISNEIFIYFNSRGLIKGIGVEYLKNNFIQHNPEYRYLTKLFTIKEKNGLFVMPKDKERVAKDKFDDFVKELIKEIKIENWENEQSPKALKGLVDVALAN